MVKGLFSVRKELRFKQVFLVEYPECEECTELRTVVLSLLSHMTVTCKCNLPAFQGT